MDNLKLYTRFMADGISKANTDAGEKYLDEVMNTSVQELIEMVCCIIAEKYDIEDGDNETMDSKLQEVTYKDLIEMLSSKNEAAN